MPTWRNLSTPSGCPHTGGTDPQPRAESGRNDLERQILIKEGNVKMTAKEFYETIGQNYEDVLERLQAARLWFYGS